ncbi:hypothetical protein PsorP6_001478 [Peronosclerospora sorghi]|uniref:Uncharacterized protein n=1 Tax=Peronosclerospora sorghi TaxID=230839 RepID=A0ACC0WUW0_9STRA|nr:hypothetical protein PsorP6_001478 [Peronosclerospora sorghi]
MGKFKRSNLIVRAYTTFSHLNSISSIQRIKGLSAEVIMIPDDVLTGAPGLSGNDVRDLVSVYSKLLDRLPGRLIIRDIFKLGVLSPR